jgi:CheY-like chemotaxis protein
MNTAAGNRGEMKRVLVVDDHPDLAHAVGVRLTQHGYRVDFAQDGAQAMMKAIQFRPDLVLLDYRMPAGNGLTVCDRLRYHPATADVPVVMLTAFADDKLRQLARAAGVRRVLEKPYAPAELLACIDEEIVTPA